MVDDPLEDRRGEDAHPQSLAAAQAAATAAAALAKAPIDDAAAAQAQGLAMLGDLGAAITAAVAAGGEGWIAAQLARILDAWGRVPEAERRQLEAEAAERAPAAVAGVVAALGELMAQDPAHQRATPLEVVRRLQQLPTELLERAGIPPVARDPAEERIAPDDRYGLGPATLAELGDPELGPLHLAWGVAKARVLRARALGGAGV